VPRIDSGEKLSVVLASNFPRDERLGSSKVTLRIGAELEAAGAAKVVDDTPAALARAIEALLGSEELWQEMSRAARRLAEAYDWGAILGRTLEQLGFYLVRAARWAFRRGGSPLSALSLAAFVRIGRERSTRGAWTE